MIDLLIVLGGALLMVFGGIILFVSFSTWREARTRLDFLVPTLFGFGLFAVGVFVIVATGRIW